jgi:RNA polymerase sigma-70 factor (ECF subfamily)
MAIDQQSQDLFGGISPTEYERLSRELTGYCYRLLGSPFDAEDAVQETMLRAWRAADQFEGRSSVRTWLHRIATNVCFDQLRRQRMRIVPMDMGDPHQMDGAAVGSVLDESTWVLPLPDQRILDSGDPALRAESRESVRLAFVAVLQRLTPRQRAALVLRDVLAFSASESALILGTSVASANSLLQRARSSVGESRAATEPDDDRELDADLLDQYVAAFEAYDIARLTLLLRADAVQSMPPYSIWLRGADSIGQFMLGPGAECKGSRLLPTAANGCAAFAQYRRDAEGRFYPWALQVVETDRGQVSALHCFLYPELFTFFGFEKDPNRNPQL